MELDDIKNIWTQYDKKLTRNLRLNEELLKKINVSNSKLELQKPLMAEITGLVSVFVLILLFIALSIRFIDELRYSVPGFLSVIVASVYFVFALLKTNRFLNIEYYGTSVTKLQKDIASLNQMVLRLRKYELMMSPLILISFPLILKAIHNRDVYSNPRFWIASVLIFAIGIPATLWINKYLYDKKFQNAANLLKEIEDFESENEE